MKMYIECAFDTGIVRYIMQKSLVTVRRHTYKTQQPIMLINRKKK